MSRRGRAATPIPEDHQREMRLRLRMLRESRGIQKSDVTTVSAGTLVNYEEHDLSTARFGDMYALAEEYGVSPKELMTFLFSDDGYDPELTPTQRRMRRIETYLTSLDDTHQELATDLVHRVVTHTVDQRQQKPPAKAPKHVAREQTAKQRVRAALSEARWREENEGKD